MKLSFTERLSLHKHYQPVPTTKVSAPKWVAFNEELASELQLTQTPELLERLAGNRDFGVEAIATRYGGHQFGHWAGQLGDGRAHLIAEINGQEIQLKGAGLTPYSRSGDGRAVLRSSVREYLCSEAMHYLGIPTTRALALVTTGDPVMRDMLYDGNPAPEPGAIVTRVAPSFIRFGHFQMMLADQDSEGMQQLLDYVLSFYPGHDGVSFFHELCERTAKLMVEWLRVGFVHGVMNTDNMSILGLTIDYGPYGWLDVYDPEWTPNTTDRQHRRYRYGQQPGIALWNLTQLSAALEMILKVDLTPALENYRVVFYREWEKMLASKLGLSVFDRELAIELEAILKLQETDMTLFYRELARGLPHEAFYSPLSVESQERLSRWYQSWLSRTPDTELMNRVNPYFVLRNYLAVGAIEAWEQNDPTPFQALERALKTPYSENENTRAFFQKRPDWARSKVGCSALSCSS